MIINTIYPAYQGEANFKGIGAPVIFIRTGGCHLRCYKDTLGTLCDTPEALELGSGTEMSVEEIVKRVLNIRAATGIRLICISGGDPLYKRPDLPELCLRLLKESFHISIETSGTLSIKEIHDAVANRGCRHNLSFVLDYKLKSAGVKPTFIKEDMPYLRGHDYIKFVAYDEEDLAQTKEVILHEVMMNTNANLVVGPYWGGKLKVADVAKWVFDNHLGGVVSVNVQLHKMATFCDLNHEELISVDIPKEI